MFLSDAPSTTSRRAAPQAAPPLFGPVPAGFPSSVEDRAEGRLDIGTLVVRHPAATFFCRAAGESMTGAGIGDGDILVVDRSLAPRDGDIVVATLDGGFTVKRLKRHNGGWNLESANPAYPAFAVDPEAGIMVWGVVAWSLSRHCRRCD